MGNREGKEEGLQEYAGITHRHMGVLGHQRPQDVLHLHCQRAFAWAQVRVR